MVEPKEYPESIRIWEEGQKVADNLVKHGEGFSLSLGKALNLADPENTAKIKKAFPEYWDVLWDPNDWMESRKVAAGMIKHGGSFVEYLGRALISANAQNQRRIKDAFPEYWQQYLEISKGPEEDQS